MKPQRESNLEVSGMVEFISRMATDDHKGTALPAMDRELVARFVGGDEAAFAE